MSHRKWGETKQQMIWWPDLALLGCCLVSLHFQCDILATVTVEDDRPMYYRVTIFVWYKILLLEIMSCVWVRITNYKFTMYTKTQLIKLVSDQNCHPVPNLECYVKFSVETCLFYQSWAENKCDMHGWRFYVLAFCRPPFLMRQRTLVRRTIFQTHVKTGVVVRDRCHRRKL